MTIHVVAHPHTDTTAAYGSCGFVNKTINFCWMMRSLGHRVFLYGGTANEAECDEFVPLVDRKEQRDVREWKHYIQPSWNPDHYVWKAFNRRAAEAIMKRRGGDDVVCVLGGNIFWALKEAVSPVPVVEYGIGYFGWGLDHRIWESAAWLNLMIRSDREPRPSPDETVIPAFFNADLFPEGQDGGYLLFLGRLSEKKGLPGACRAAARAGRRLLVAGVGEKKLATHGSEFVGEVGLAERNRLIAGADALLCPSTAFEAFGNIVPEAGLCGTRVLSGCMGAFNETVEHGVTGFVCGHSGRLEDELVQGIQRLFMLADRKTIRAKARARWSRTVIRDRYASYFARLTDKARPYNDRDADSHTAA